MAEVRIMGKYWEDFNVGDRVYSLGRTVTEADLVNFLNFTHIHEELFMNAEYAMKKSALKKRIVPWPLTLCFAQGLSVGTGYLHHTLMYGLGVDEVRMHRPVEIGDTLQVVIEVLDKRESRSHPEGGIVQVQRSVVNQRDEVVMTYKVTGMFRKRAVEQVAKT